MEVLRSSLVMLEMHRRQLQLRHMLASFEREAMKLLTRLREGLWVNNRSVGPSAGAPEGP
jgi:hypothetical protein